MVSARRGIEIQLVLQQMFTVCLQCFRHCGRYCITADSKTGKRPCLHGAYILARETDNSQINQKSITYQMIIKIKQGERMRVLGILLIYIGYQERLR